MKIKVAWVGKTKAAEIQRLSDEYVKRISRYAEIEGVTVKDEAAILAIAAGSRCKLVPLDSRGKQYSSEEFAVFLEREQVNAVPLLFAIGGSDGFGDEVRKKAGFVWSLGKLTLPHELARVVMLEQIYRAFTILRGHPYHVGH